MIRAVSIAMTLLAMLITGMTTAQAAPNRVVADLSDKSVAITSDYHGTELLLFGAVDGEPGDDVVLIVTGPETRIAQRRKDKVAGIWVNVETNIWESAPSFYHLFSTRPLAEIAAADVLRASGIGADSLSLSVVPEKKPGDLKDSEPVNRLNSAPLIKGLERNMRELGLWAVNESSISLQRNTLFRTTLALPKNVPTGDYRIKVVQFRNGIAISEETTDMNVTRQGLSARIYNFAHDYSALYGIFAIAFAVVAGWLAAVAFRKG